MLFGLENRNKWKMKLTDKEFLSEVLKILYIRVQLYSYTFLTH